MSEPRAARSYGLQAQGYRYETQALKKNAVLPCILHWNFNHFVVLRGFTKRKALLNDPARGAVSVPMEEFDRSFTADSRGQDGRFQKYLHLSFLSANIWEADCKEN